MKKLALAGLIATAFLTSCAEVDLGKIKDVGLGKSSFNPVKDDEGKVHYGYTIHKVPIETLTISEKSKLIDNFFYYYFYYLFNPKVINALANGETKIENVPIVVNNKTLKITFGYPNEIKDIFQTCKQQGGDIKIKIVSVWVDGRFDGSKNLDISANFALLDYRKFNRYLVYEWEGKYNFGRYPIVSCEVNQKPLYSYAIVPVSRIKAKSSEYYYDYIVSKDYYTIIPKVCFTKIDGNNSFIENANTIISDYGMRGIFDAVGIAKGLDDKAFYKCEFDDNGLVKFKTYCEVK